MPLEGHIAPQGKKIKQASSVSRLATKDQLEVCPLSRGGMSHPLSGPLQPGIRFFQPPIPAQPTASLAVRLPEPNCAPAAIRAYHVPCTLHDWVRAYLFAGGSLATCPDDPAGHPTTYRLVSAYQQLWHCNAYDVYQQFTYITHTSQPGSSTPSLLGVSAHHPHGE